MGNFRTAMYVGRHKLVESNLMPVLSVTYNPIANTLDFLEPGDRRICVIPATGYPVTISVGAPVGGSEPQWGTRLGYPSEDPQSGRARIILLTIETSTRLCSSTAVSEPLNTETATAFLESASSCWNPVGALRDLINFTPPQRQTNNPSTL